MSVQQFIFGAVVVIVAYAVMSVQIFICFAVVVVVGFAISLRLHPYAKCRACGGSSKHFGAIYRYAFRACRRCEGKGRKPRLGSRVFYPDLK